VFFLPTVTDEYEEVDIDTMLCEGMEVIANSLQEFGSWGRRVGICSPMPESEADSFLRAVGHDQESDGQSIRTTDFQ
jgi:phosphoglycolate phosphatase-like HAD superfamily hydrolase